jgi:serine/threonine protein kinase
MSNQITSLWYRAPEIILGSEEYLTGVDMWSVGCIFFDLLGLRPLFEANNEFTVINKIIRMVGFPSGDMLEKLK